MTTTTIYPERNENLSIVYWLKSLFPSFIRVEEGFPEELLSLPTVAVEWDDIDGRHFELGNRNILKERVWYIDIYANTDTQRDEITFEIFNKLEDGVSVQDYNDGFPENGITPRSVGRLLTKRRQAKSIPVDVDLTEKMYYRAIITFTAVYQQT